MNELFQKIAEFEYFEFGLGIVVAAVIAVVSDSVKSIILKIQKLMIRISMKLFGKIISKIKYAYRIIVKKPSFSDLVHIQGKFKNLSANNFELQAFRKKHKTFTTMQDYNEKKAILSKVKIEYHPSLPLIKK